MRERPVPGRERGRVAVGAGDGDGQEGRFDRPQVRAAVQRESVAVDGLPCLERRQRLRLVGAGDGDRAEELEVRLRAVRVRVGVEDNAVAAWCREDDPLCDPAVRPDRRVAVDDRTEVAADDDQVDAGVRPRAAPVVGQRRAVGLADREGDRRPTSRLDRCGRGEARELIRAGGSDRDRGAGGGAPASGRERGRGQGDDERVRSGHMTSSAIGGTTRWPPTTRRRAVRSRPAASAALARALRAGSAVTWSWS